MANVQPKSSIPIGAKVEIGPKGVWDARYALTSSVVQRWFRFSFCTPFSTSSVVQRWIRFSFCTPSSTSSVVQRWIRFSLCTPFLLCTFLQEDGFLIYLLHTQSQKGEFLKKPCGRTTQFFIGLHCQARNQRRTELVRGSLASRQGLYTMSQGWHRKELFNLPQVTNKCWTLWPCIGPKAGKRIPSNLGGRSATLRPMFQHLLISWHPCSSIY